MSIASLMGSSSYGNPAAFVHCADVQWSWAGRGTGFADPADRFILSVSSPDMMGIGGGMRPPAVVYDETPSALRLVRGAKPFIGTIGETVIARVPLASSETLLRWNKKLARATPDIVYALAWHVAHKPERGNAIRTVREIGFDAIRAMVLCHPYEGFALIDYFERTGLPAIKTQMVALRQELLGQLFPLDQVNQTAAKGVMQIADEYVQERTLDAVDEIYSLITSSAFPQTFGYLVFCAVVLRISSAKTYLLRLMQHDAPYAARAREIVQKFHLTEG